MNSASAGPGQATQPSFMRYRRWPSRGSSASRSCSANKNCSCPVTALTGSSSWNPVRVAHPGTARPRSNLSKTNPAPGMAISAGSPSGAILLRSTGLPNAMTLLMPSLRRYAEVW